MEDSEEQPVIRYRTPPTPEVIVETPDDAGLHLYSGICEKRAGQAEIAREHFEIAIQLRPEWDYPHFQLATLLSESGDEERALSEYQRALHLLPNTKGPQREQAEALMRSSMANHLQKMGRMEEAREQLQQAIALQREFVAKYPYSEQLLRRFEKALADMGE